MIPRHAVQLYEAIAYAIIFVLLILVYRRKENASRHGMLLGLFLVLVFLRGFCLNS